MLSIDSLRRLTSHFDVTFLFLASLRLNELNDLNMIIGCMILLLTGNRLPRRQHPMEVWFGIGMQVNLICSFEAHVNVFILSNNLIGRTFT